MSPKEMQEIDTWLLLYGGESYRRIWNIPLIVEENPENPPLTMIT